MGGRQSQEPAPAAVDVTPPPPRRHSSASTPPRLSFHPTPPPSHHHLPPPSHQDASPHLPTLSEYSHMRRSAREHSRSGGSEHQSLGGSRSTQRTSEDQLLELNIALSTLQQRLQARADARERSHQSTLHSASLPTGLPLLFFRPIPTMQCPVCSKEISSSEMETHMSQCMSRPRVTYNVDTLAQMSGECSICLEDMLPGEDIARLPCLCIYHLQCAKQWFKVSQTCPEHPDLA